MYKNIHKLLSKRQSTYFWNFQEPSIRRKPFSIFLIISNNQKMCSTDHSLKHKNDPNSLEINASRKIILYFEYSTWTISVYEFVRNNFLLHFFLSSFFHQLDQDEVNRRREFRQLLLRVFFFRLLFCTAPPPTTAVPAQNFPHSVYFGRRAPLQHPSPYQTFSRLFSGILLRQRLPQCGSVLDGWRENAEGQPEGWAGRGAN